MSGRGALIVESLTIAQWQPLYPCLRHDGAQCVAVLRRVEASGDSAWRFACQMCVDEAVRERDGGGDDDPPLHDDDDRVFDVDDTDDLCGCYVCRNGERDPDDDDAGAR